jgi:hypothetical protein
MKLKLNYQHVDRNELADYLAQCEILSAEAIDGSHVYRCRDQQQESLVIALPAGDALIVTNPPPLPVDRRRRAR